MQSLLLTSSEKALFDALPETVREGWNVDDAGEIAPDTPQKRLMRLSLMRIHSPSLIAFVSAARENPDRENLAALIASTDLSMVSDEDFMELFFALGTEVLTLVINGLLQSAKTDQDLETIAGLTAIRHAQSTSQRLS